MPETEAFHLAPPTEEDLDVAEAAWQSGQARYAMRTDDVWWRVLRASSQAEARQFASTWYASPVSQRFTPLYKGGQIVPAAYAGSTRVVSLWEVILRNVRHEGIRRISEHQVRDRYLTEVSLQRRLHLFDIRRPRDSYLTTPGKRAPDLTAAWPEAYHLTRLWAQALYDRIPNLDGIIYESHQIAGHCVALYQQEKTGTALFTIEDDPQLIRDGDAREFLLREARKAGVSVDFGEVDDADDTET